MSALLAAPCALQAQTDSPRLADNSIVVENKKVEQTDHNLVVDLTFNMDSLHLRSNQRLVFTPIVRSTGGQERTMPQIIVNGRKQDISYKRYAHKDYPDDAQVVRRKNGTAQSYEYNAIVPYEEWMKNADVVIAEDLCGCGNVEEQDQTVIQRLRTPYMAYLRPKAEARKARTEEGRAFIDFPVDKTTLYPDYRNNPRELDKIVNTINLVKEDKNVSITGIEIHGYASPEAPYNYNARLAEGRAKTLTDHVRRLVNLEDRLFKVTSTPEDWDGLREAVLSSNLEHKQEILDIIDDNKLTPDTRERKIKSNYPKEYRFMLDTYYPALRHSDYVVSYTVRPFSVEEAKEILRTKPKQLSLEEMYLVAQTYEPGSDEFNEVFQTAVHLYPEDETANLNAACAEIERGDYKAASRYLAKAGNSPYAAHARGVMAMKQGNDDEARRQFTIAAQGGVKEAQQNLDIMGN